MKDYALILRQMMKLKSISNKILILIKIDIEFLKELIKIFLFVIFFIEFSNISTVFQEEKKN